MTPELLTRARQLVASGGRILGLAGPPGVGKSTLADELVAAVGPSACLLPMDGFHLTQADLVRLGRSERKGAPDTFDVEGYLAALGRVRERRHDVLVPRFDRTLDEPVADALRVGVEHRLVVTEGNYLLLDLHPWSQVRSLLHECWWLELDCDVRRSRLITRHRDHGRSAEAATRWVDDVDEPNAQLIARHRSRPDLVLPG